MIFASHDLSVGSSLPEYMHAVCMMTREALLPLHVYVWCG